MSNRSHDYQPMPGSECLITDLGNDPQVAQRLAQMGVLPGTRLRIVRLAPLGDTLEVAVEQGELLALRRDELDALACQYQVLPLSQVERWGPGLYRVLSLANGHTFRDRVDRHGMEPGSILQVLHPGQWPLRVEMEKNGESLRLGHGEAVKILVERADG